MSRAAEDYVNACTHPKVKGATRALLFAIAKHIPDGQTTTPPIALDDLATTARHSGRTARTCRPVLEALGEIKVHDGGQGKVARYELLRFVDGARPLTAAPLPLLGRPKPPRTKKQRSTSDLFSEEAARTSEVSADVARRPILNIGSFFLRWCAYFGSFFLSWWPRTIKERSTSAVSSDVALPLDATTTYVRTEDLEAGGDARAREPADAFLTWFETTYPAVHQGAACTVLRPRDGPLVRELLQRPRTDVSHLQAMAHQLWTVTSDGVPKSDRWWIAERVTVRNIVVLHRKADFLDREVRRQGTAAADELDEARREVERRLGRDWRKSG